MKMNRNRVRLLEVLDKAQEGPVTDERHFQSRMIPQTLRELQKKYEINYDGKTIIPNDDAFADRLFEAGMEMAETLGVLCTSTGRRITFTRAELEHWLRYVPAQVEAGAGRDRAIFYSRRPEDERPPGVAGGPFGQTDPEDYFIELMQSYAQEPIFDVIWNGSLATVYGRSGRTRSPWEVLQCWEEAALSKEAARRAGRPDIGIGCVSSATSEVGELSSSAPGGFRPTDCHRTCFMAELKTDYSLLSKVAHFIASGVVPVHSFYNPILGGYVGGPEGVAIAGVGGHILLQMVNMTSTHSLCTIHPFHHSNTVPQLLWATSSAHQALNRNTDMLTTILCSPVGGPGTKILLRECAAAAITGSVSGVARVDGVRTTGGKEVGHASGLEARLYGEVARSLKGVTRADADRMVKALTEKYMPEYESHPIGKTFDKVYDLTTIKPLPEWQEMYEEVKAEVRELGVPLP